MKGTWTALAVTLAIQAAASIAMFSPPVLAPALGSALGIPASAVGLLTAVIYIACMASSTVSGPVIGRWGPLRLSQIALLSAGIGIALFASAWLPLVLLGALLVGAGYGPTTPASSVILVARTPENIRATVLSLKQTGVPLGGMLAGAALPPVILAFGWQAAAVGIGAVAIVLAFAVQPVRAELDPPAQRQSKPIDWRALLEPMRVTFGHRRLTRLAVIAVIYSGTQIALASYLVVYLIERAQFSLVAAGSGLSAYMLAGLLGRIAWGAITDRTRAGARVLGFLGLWTSAACCTLALVSANWPAPLVIVASFAAGASAIGWNGVFIALLAEEAPKGMIAIATGAAMTFCYLGVVLIPTLFWAVHALLASYTVAFVFVAVATAAASTLLLRGWREAGAAC